MSSSQLGVPSKSSQPTAAASTAQFSTPPAGLTDNSRSRGAGSGGAVSTGRNTAVPRNNQASRKNHRNHRRPNTPRYDHSIEEQVAMTSSSGRRGTSITHLINWDVAAPRYHHYQEAHRPRATRRNPTWGVGSGYHAADKARYINANYRFIVDPRGDYRAQAVDPDVPLQWDRVLQVLASARSQCPNCPICLSEPKAPRMARCGHIFCLPCLLRYMDSSDEKDERTGKKPKHKNCVICTDTVYMTDVRAVRFYTGQEDEMPREGGDIVLRLLMRKPGSTLALPRDGGDYPEKVEEIPWYSAAEILAYARVMKGTEDYMRTEYTREIQELIAEAKEDRIQFGDSDEWPRKAVGLIKQQIEEVDGMGNNPESMPRKKEEQEEKEEKKLIEFTPGEDAPDMYLIQHEARSGRSTNTHTPSPPEEPPTPELPIAPTPPAPTPHKLLPARLDGEPYFFYHFPLHYYLAPLDIRILRSHFSTYTTFPSTLLPRIENVTTGHTVDHDLKKRTKYLAHLPDGCEVGFLECNWDGIVGEEVLGRFKVELEKRRRRKREKEDREEAGRRRAEREGEAWVRREEPSMRERFRAEDFVELTPTPPSGNDFLGGSSPPLASTPAAGSTSASSKTVWGTPALPSATPPPPTTQTHVTRDDAGWMPDWQQRELLLAEEVEAQIAAEEEYESVGVRGRNGGGGAGQGKGKKKRKGKVTIMSTGGKRGLI